MRIKASFLDNGSIDYEADRDGCDHERLLAVGVAQDSTAALILTQLRWQIDRGVLPEVTDDAALAVLAPQAEKAADAAALIEGQEALAWFRVEWSS